MLKYLYKTLLIAVMSGGLATFPISSAMADGNTSMTTDTNGVTTTKSSYDMEKVSNSDFIASIAMIAGGYIASRMAVTYKPITNDVAIAAAAGVAFVAGEVLSNVKYKGTIDQMTLEVERKNDQTINEEQIQRLQDLKKSYEEAKSSVKTKKTLQLAAAAGFGVAALTSTYYMMTEEAQVNICRGVIQTSKAKLLACNANVSESAQCSTCLGLIQKYEIAFNKQNIERQPPAVSFAKASELKPEQTFLTLPNNYCAGVPGLVTQSVVTDMSACSKAVLQEFSSQTSASTPEAPVGFLRNLLIPQNILMVQEKLTNVDRILNLFFPRAEAGWLPLLGLAASTVAALKFVSGTIAEEYDMLMFIPKNRAIVFGAMAGLAYMASKSSDNVLQKIDSNINKIDGILADLEKQGKGVKGSNVQKVSMTTQALSGISYSTDGKTTSPCATSNASSNCKTLTSALTTTTGFSSLPESLQGLALDTMKVADGVSGTSSISGATLAAADALGNKQAAIRNLLKKTQESQLKKSGDKISPETREKNLLSSMGAKIKSGLDKKGMSASGLMASIGATPIDSTSTGKDSSTTVTNAKASGVPTDLNIGTGGKESFNLDFKEDKSVGDLAMATNNGAGAAQYDINVNDISKENGPSIFEVISNRYLKSGYPKLLEVEETKTKK